MVFKCQSPRLGTLPLNPTEDCPDAEGRASGSPAVATHLVALAIALIVLIASKSLLSPVSGRRPRGLHEGADAQEPATAGPASERRRHQGPSEVDISAGGPRYLPRTVRSTWYRPRAPAPHVAGPSTGVFAAATPPWTPRCGWPNRDPPAPTDQAPGAAPRFGPWPQADDGRQPAWSGGGGHAVFPASGRRPGGRSLPRLAGSVPWRASWRAWPPVSVCVHALGRPALCVKGGRLSTRPRFSEGFDSTWGRRRCVWLCREGSRRGLVAWVLLGAP
jgi:hypothetical protein